MFLFLLVSVEPAFSHSGGTDSSGCHAGSQPYHCHDEDDDNGCAIAGPEDTNGRGIIYNPTKLLVLDFSSRF